MSAIPLLTHYQACPTRLDRDRARVIAESIARTQPRLGFGREFPQLVPRELIDAPVLHLDDFSEITLPETYGPIDFLEDRARMRAGEGDYIVTAIEPVEGYEEYCRTHLNLGAVQWLRAERGIPPRHLAASCWVDRRLRRELIRTDFRYLHPHMGSFAVWALADLLHRASGRELSVIAPPPSLTRAVNDKLWFADVVSRLLGEKHVPRTVSAANFVSMAHAVRELSRDSTRLVIKLTDSVGGGGNLVLDAERFRDLPLGTTRQTLKTLLEPLEWRGECDILVGSWETEVLSAPSSQLWIPPLGSGEPRVEGLFDQVVEGREGFFVGTRPARLPRAASQRIVDMSWLLGRLLQRLGYVGRCSFDLILVGSDIDTCDIEFVECNGRWGGTSLPMTMLTRVFGDWIGRSFACLDCELPRSGERGGLRFGWLVEMLGNRLYDARNGRGDLILFNPAACVHREIGVIGLGSRYLEDPRTIERTTLDLLAHSGQAA